MIIKRILAAIMALTFIEIMMMMMMELRREGLGVHIVLAA